MTQRDEWYEDGLQFSCTQCGNCCTGPPGYVWFTDAEAVGLAAYLKLDEPDFRKTFAHKIGGKWTLNETETEHGFDCIFLRRDEQGKALCSVYPVRPKQCRTWPFWEGNLASEATWARAGQRCPGMDKGTFYPIEKIRVIRDSNPKD
ncbi:MAG: YkgJ family cysteine cluster protein [Planctomycetes bacterium]|nr:YkgJ family cysteine cluster protein [Planctomycetota bacterium]